MKMLTLHWKWRVGKGSERSVSNLNFLYGSKHMTEIYSSSTKEAIGLQGQVPGQAAVLAVDLRAGIASTAAFPCLLNDSAPRSPER